MNIKSFQLNFTPAVLLAENLRRMTEGTDKDDKNRTVDTSLSIYLFTLGCIFCISFCFLSWLRVILLFHFKKNHYCFIFNLKIISSVCGTKYPIAFHNTNTLPSLSIFFLFHFHCPSCRPLHMWKSISQITFYFHGRGGII